MSIFEHQRFEIFHPGQHPMKHTLADFGYANPAFGSQVTNLEQAMDWVLAVLYPSVQASVANQAALPAAGNTINDMRVVLNDGDTKAATYRWEQREGDAVAKWYKIYDMDWGYDSILSATLSKTQDIYVVRQGYDDLDDTGTALTGVNAGQHIYGGKSASTHLTLHANSGDGTGAQTGYVQLTDNVRPTTDSALSLGTTALRWLKIWTDEVTVGTMTIAAGSIVDTSGLIDLGATNLTTTGVITAGSITAGTSATFGTTTIGNALITDTTGAISFSNENLTTTGTLASGVHTIGTLVLSGASITDTSGTISFDNENLTTTGAITGGQVNAENLRLDGNTLSSTSGGITISAFATVVDVTTAMTTIGQTVTGTLGVTGQLNIDNLRLDGNTFSSTDVNGNVAISPNGSGLVTTSAIFQPTTDGLLNLGAIGSRWNKIYFDDALSDGTTEITQATLQSLRDINVSVASGMSLFYNGTKWVSSVPDTEVDHGTVSGLGDDDHTQYALLAGRSGGQEITGGTASGNSLTLESTTHAAKGTILFSSVPAPTNDNVTDTGTVSLRWKNLYMNGQAVGMRLANYTTAGRPSASASNIGRIIWDTDLADVFVDLGGSWRQITSEQYYEEDAVNWEGTATTVTYNVSSSVNNSRALVWALKKNSDNYLQIKADIDFPTATSVRVTVGIPLAAGTYTLIGR